MTLASAAWVGMRRRGDKSERRTWVPGQRPFGWVNETQIKFRDLYDRFVSLVTGMIYSHKFKNCWCT